MDGKFSDGNVLEVALVKEQQPKNIKRKKKIIRQKSLVMK